MDDWGGSRMDDKLMLALEEYKTLRQEILNSITAQYAILTFGATGVALLATAVLGEPGGNADTATAASTKSIFGIGGLLVGIPLLCLLIVAMWMNEVTRMLRAGQFLLGAEERLNSLVGRDGVVSWESVAHAEDEPDIERSHFRLVVLFFGTLALAFVSFGLFKLWTVESMPQLLRVVATIAEALLLALGTYTLYGVARSYNEVRERWLNADGSRTRR